MLEEHVYPLPPTCQHKVLTARFLFPAEKLTLERIARQSPHLPAAVPGCDGFEHTPT
jgi:hypothetical protein